MVQAEDEDEEDSAAVEFTIEDANKNSARSNNHDSLSEVVQNLILKNVRRARSFYF